MAESETRKFKVIIAGGGVVGLTLANVLEKAGIDYVLLEKRDIAPNLGLSIVICPNSVRPLKQLGIWETLKDSAFPILVRKNCNDDGRLFHRAVPFALAAKGSGQDISFMDRKFFLQSLYDNVQDKSKIHARVGVESYVETAEGVTVMTDKGERIEGSMIVGADGVHSRIRKLIAESVAKTNPTLAKSMGDGMSSLLFCTTRTNNGAGSIYLRLLDAVRGITKRVETRPNKTTSRRHGRDDHLCCRLLHWQCNCCKGHSVLVPFR
jgi:2-polyprenyl-6-methoxyphenol hydroxylase-like FAD-dependent oxidoreductase